MSKETEFAERIRALEVHQGTIIANQDRQREQLAVALENITTMTSNLAHCLDQVKDIAHWMREEKQTQTKENTEWDWAAFFRGFKTAGGIFFIGCFSLCFTAMCALLIALNAPDAMPWFASILTQ